MDYPYKTREGGATVTVFVPYDCGNHCPFCINKAEYKDTTGFSLEKICQSIHRMNAITPLCDFVFTGGEPLADLKALQIMLDAIPPTHKIYINTTLPVSEKQPEEDVLHFLERNKHKIACLNISRHLQHYVEESNDDLLKRLPVKLRVNCVLYQNYSVEKLVPYLERFRKIPKVSVQFRFDYTATTPQNLYDQQSDRILHDLRQIAKATGLEGCRMRCGFHFDYLGMPVVYHKTLPYSTIIEHDIDDHATYKILYDILIKQNGDIHSDWTGDLLDVSAYEKAVFEPYDLRWVKLADGATQ